MKTPIILQRLILGPNTFFTNLDFQFKNNLKIIYGDYGTGKSALLKIIKFLTDDKESIDLEFFKHIFRNKKDKNKSIIFKYDLNPIFLNYDHPVIICIHITEENNIEITSEPPFSSHEIEQIIKKLNIQYLNFDEIFSSVNSENQEDITYLSRGEQIWKNFLEKTGKLENSLILVDDLHPMLDVAQKILFFQYIYDLGQHNQIIITSSSSLVSSETSSMMRGFFHSKRFSEYQLKNPWQENIYDYYKEDLKSDYYKEFQLGIKNIKKILKLKLTINEKRLEDFLIRILYANIITTMETYLSDCFIEKIINNKKFIPKLLELVPEFYKEKFNNPKKAYDWFENMNDNVIKVLTGISFHNLDKVISMYKNILNIEFPKELGDIFRAISIRHDIVHRNGKTKENEEILLIKQDLDDLIEFTSEFIRYIELQAKEI